MSGFAAKKYNLACIGDSITADTYTNAGGAYPRSDAFPAKVQLLLGYNLVVTNNARPGQIFEGSFGLISQIPLIQSQYDPTALRNTAHILCGTNEFIGSGITAALAYTYLQQFVTNLKAGNAWDRVIVGTMLPCINLTNTMNQANYFAYNNSIRTGSGGSPSYTVCDYAADPLMGQWLAVTNATGSAPITFTINGSPDTSNLPSVSQQYLYNVGIVANGLYTVTKTGPTTFTIPNAATGSFSSDPNAALNAAGNQGGSTTNYFFDAAHPNQFGFQRMVNTLAPLILMQ